MATSINFPITNLTQAAAQQYLQNDGLETLGLTTVALSPHWSVNALNQADYNSTNLTLAVANGNLTAPFRGLLSGAFSPASSFLAGAIGKDDAALSVLQNDGNLFPSPNNPDSVILEISKANGSAREFVKCTNRNANLFVIERGWDGSARQEWEVGDRVSLKLGRSNRSVQFYGADGAHFTVPCAVFRFHPQAALRLERLMIDRLTPGGPGILPVPVCMVVQNAQHFKTDQFFNADAMLPVGGAISFHDARGLIVDPIYVASVFAALLQWLPALKPASVAGGTGDANGITAISNFANGTLIHVVDMHGSNLQPSTGMLVRQDNNGDQNVSTNLPFVLPPNNQLKGADFTRLRWGWMGNGVMGTNLLTPPNLNVNLPRRFYRVCLVDLNWALVGNRTDQEQLGIQAADQRISEAQFLPKVRDQVTIDYLPDGPDTLAEGTRLLAPTAQQQFRMAISPAIDNTMDTPATRGAAAHWPQYPAPAVNNPGGFPAQYPVTLTNANVAAAWAPNNKDVVLTLTGVAMFNDHVRVYPQVFVPIEAIATEPSFIRGDGGSSLAIANPVTLLLSDPFAIGSGQQPDPAILTLDVVVTPRGGPRQMWGAVNVPVNGNASLPPNPFPQGPNPPLNPVPNDLRGITAFPIFGVPVTTQATPAPPNPTFAQLAMSLAAEPSPRQAPRLPTMARFETMLVAGDGPSTDAPLTWDAVVTGGHWTPETRSAAHSRGNPGNPAGPDLHAPGVRVTGGLAYDVAYAALRRSQPMIPWPQTATTWNAGWTVFAAGNNFNPPDDSVNTGNTSAGALLRTIAIGCETSQLAGMTPPADQNLEDYLTDLFGFTIDLDIQNEPRLRNEIRREFFIATHGLRDTQYSLLRAISQARELIYIESPQFARTALDPLAPPPNNTQVDLVAAIAARLAALPNLKVVICTPRLSDFNPAFTNWARYHYTARKEAIEMLLGVAPDRVAVFHPVGFPGRPAYIRTTSVIVDDVWSLVGAAHFRRRGMTFDGSVAIASLDRTLESGYSKKVRDYRRALMALKLAVAPPAGAVPASGEWIRLQRPESAFALVQDLLEQGGVGRIQPLWPGPSDNVLPAQEDAADPDGTRAENFEFMTTMASILDQLGR